MNASPAAAPGGDPAPHSTTTKRKGTTPRTLAVYPDGIPDELKEIPQWVSWRWARRDGKWTKPPVDPKTNGAAKSTDSATWGTFSQALACKQEQDRPGIGLVLTKDLGIVGVDLDHCLTGAEHDVAPWAQTIIDRFASYTTVSPTGTGVRIFARGTLPVGGKKHDAIEIYCAERYLTMTGQRVPGTPETVQPAQEAIDALCSQIVDAQHNREESPQPTSMTSPALTNDEILEHARHAANAARFQALFDRGDVAGYAGDESRADAALAAMLAFWTQDADQIAQLMRRSSLYRAKYERADYLPRTIEAVLSHGGERYAPPDPAPRMELVNGHILRVVGSDAPEDDDDDALPTRPRLFADSDVRVLTQAVRDLLSDAKDEDTNPVLYRMDGNLAVIRGGDEHRETRVLDVPELGALIHRGAEVVHMVRIVGKGEQVRPTVVPAHTLRVIRAALDAGSATYLPAQPLAGIVHTPYVDGTGALITQTGYNPADGRFADIGERLREITVPDAPTDADVAAAKELLAANFVKEFDWVDKDKDSSASVAHYWALLLAPAIRATLPVTALLPLFMITKPSPGSGATYAAELAASLYTGRPVHADAIPAMDDLDEWRKSLLTILREQRLMAIFDNAEGAVGNAVLDAVLTSPRFGGRQLGVNAYIEAANTTTWVVTGNNIYPSRDTIRRSLVMRIDTKKAHPEKRVFTRDLALETIERQGVYLTAVLTIIKAWFARGKPSAETLPFASFDSWAKRTNAILTMLGIEGFLENRDEIREEADQEGGEWGAFLTALAGRGKFKVGAITQEVTRSFEGQLPTVTGYALCTGLRESAPADLKRVDGTKRLRLDLGNALRTRQDRPFGGYVLRLKDVHGGSSSYEVEKLKDE